MRRTASGPLATSNSRYTRREDRSGVPQIDELFRMAKLCVFFIDENQIVRPTEIGSVSLIKETATRFGVKSENWAEFELKTQFRCSGSDAYLQWLDKVLSITDSENLAFDVRMQFKIFSTPSEMMEEIRQRNAEKRNSARIVAGFCWPWSDPNPDGSLVNDVRIGDFAMPWEKKDTFWKWATSRNSHDTQVKRNNPDLARHLQNVYRVLISRAHRGVYVHFMNPETEQRFRSALPQLT